MRRISYFVFIITLQVFLITTSIFAEPPGESSSCKTAEIDNTEIAMSPLVSTICIQSNYNGGVPTENVMVCVATTQGPTPMEGCGPDYGSNWIGDFVEGDCANHNLLYSFADPESRQPWTCWVSFKIDGYVYNIRGHITGTLVPTMVTAPYAIGDSIYTVWEAGGMRITQKLSPRQINGPGSATILFQYFLENISSTCHDVGVLLQLDTNINTNDNTRISTYYGYENHEQEFLAPDMPYYWQAWEFDDLTGMVAQGDLLGPEAVMPDRVCIGPWGFPCLLGYYMVYWDYTATFGLYDDSAVLLWWDPDSVCPGETRYVGTYYGLGASHMAEGDLQLNINPIQLHCVRCGELSPDPFEFVLLITNNFYSYWPWVDDQATNVQATITIDHPECLEMVSGSATQFSSPSTLEPGLLGPPGETGTVAWRFSPNRDCMGDTVCFHIDVTNSNSEIADNSIDYCFYIPVCTGSPPSVFAGNDTALCLGDSIRIGGSPTASEGSPPYTYAWSPATNISDIYAANPIVYPTVPTIYNVVVVDDSGCTGRAQVLVNVSDPFVDAGRDELICDNDTVMLGGSPIVEGGIEPYYFEWYPPDDLDNPYAPFPLAYPGRTTEYILTVTDSIGCIDMDTVIVEVANSPLIIILVPHPCDSITSCEYQEIVFQIIDSTSAIDTLGLQLDIEGELYDIRSMELDWLDPDRLVFTPTSPWRHGDTVHFTLQNVRNLAGCEADPVSCSFIVDIEPPVPANEQPHADTVIFTPTPEISIDITDFPAGIDPASFDPANISITINGTPASGYTINWDGLTLTINGLTFFDGDNVTVCLDNLFDDPFYDYCEPNDTSYCWSFLVALSGPIAEIIRVLPDSITACDPESIVIYLAGTLAPVDPSTIELYIDGVLYTIDSDYLEYYPEDSLLIYAPPPGYWEPYDGDSVHVRLERADDEHGAPLSDTLDWYFWVDYSPPVFWGLEPHPDTTVATATPDIQISMFDSLSGLDEDSFYMVINGSMEFRIGDAGVSWDGTTFVLSPGGAGFSFTDGETVEVCVESIQDMPDYCEPNDTSTCWRFIVSISGPVPAIIQYLAGTYVACREQLIIMTITDPDGVDPASIILEVEGIIYTVDSTGLDFIAGSTLHFRPSPAWTNAQVVDICLLEAEDSLGNPMEEPLCWSFIMDLSPPTAWGEHYPDGSIVPPYAPPNFSVYLYDSLSGIDVADRSYIWFRSCGEIFELDGPYVTWVEDSNLARFYYPYEWCDTCMEICVTTMDSPDYCAFNQLDYCWNVCLTDGPHAEIVSPLPGQITACSLQCIYMHLWDDDMPVDSNTIALIVEGDTFHIWDVELTYDGYNLTFCPAAEWLNEQTVDVTLIYADDSVGAHLIDTLDWDFRVDLEAPEVTNITPTPGSTVGLTQPPICFDLDDNLSGVDWASFILYIDGTPYDTGSPGIGIIGTRVCFHPADIGLSWVGGDTVNICLHAEDSPDLCDPNALDTCWEFYIEPGPPEPYIIRPHDGAISGCPDEYIHMQILDDDGVVPSSIELYVSRFGCTIPHVYTTDSSGLTFTYPDLYFNPTPPFIDGEEICVCLYRAADSIGNVFDDTLCWSFVMDLTPPVIWDEVPGPGDIVATRYPIVSFILQDSIAGLDVSSVLLTIAGEPYSLFDPAVDWSEHIVTWFSEIAGTSFACGDTVEVCVYAADLVDSIDYCGPNILDTCWYFFIETGGPEAETIRPLPNTFSSCVDESIAIHLWDLNGVDTMTIILRVEGIDYDISTPELTYDSSLELLVFHPSPPFPDSALVEVELIQADDILGCPLETPLSWSFIMDRTPPHFIDFDSICGATLLTTQPNMRFIIIDTICGLDRASVRISVDGTWYDTTAPGVFMRGDTLFFFSDTVGVSFPGGSTVDICFLASDDIDYCEDNVLDTCCSFMISPGGPVGQIVRPEDGIISACPAESIMMYVIDEDGVRGSTILLEVSRYGCTVPHTYTTDSTQLRFTEPDLVFQPTPGFQDGEEICVTLLEAEDILGNTLTSVVSWSFIMDLSPPYITSQDPLPGVFVSSTTPTICVGILDDISGVNTDRLVLQIDGTPYGIGNPGISWVGDEICFDPVAGGVTWYGGDVIEVCVHADDSPDSGYCEPNAMDSCWSFTISPGGPVGTIVRPADSVISACPAESILMDIFDEDGVVSSTILLEVSRYGCTVTHTYTTDSSQLTFDEPVLAFNPTPPFEDGEVICVSLLEAEDVLGNTLTEVVSWSFMMDLSPPVILSQSPQPGDIVPETAPLICIEITDDISGLNEGEIIFGIDRVAYWIGDPGISWTPSQLCFDPTLAGISWSGGENVGVCIYAIDSPDSGYCDPNVLDSCWSFTIEPGGPEATPVRPLDSTFVACVPESLQYIEVTLFDENGVDPATIVLRVEGIPYTLDSAQLAFVEPQLKYIPREAFQDAQEVNVCIEQADDILGNPLQNPQCWIFIMDLSPPEFDFISPECNSMTPDNEQDIVVQITDALSGLDPTSVTLTINGTAYYPTDFSVDNGLLHFRPENNDLTFAPSDTVCFEVYACDLPDYCGPNCASDSCCFTIEPRIECLVHPNPFTPNTDEINDYTIFDYPNMFMKNATLRIYTLRNEEVFTRKLERVNSVSEITKRDWRGVDNEGKKLPEGIYIYIIDQEGKIICNGTVILAR